MSIAGLRFGADGRGSALSTPHETKSGSYITRETQPASMIGNSGLVLEFVVWKKH